MASSGRNVARRHASEQGQALIVTALGMTVLLGFMALGIDIGYYRHQRNRMQSAADAAAVAGASQLLYGGAKAPALRDAKLNGFETGVDGVTVTVDTPPVSGPNLGKTGYVEVVIAQPQPTFFARVLGYDTVNVGARAVARNSGKTSVNCIYALNPTQSGSAHVDGGNRLDSTCGVVVDSSSSSAVTVSGALQAPVVNIVGGYTGPITGTVKTGIIAVNDPLAYVQPPAVGACDRVNYSISSGAVTLNPGVYCGGITISNNAQVTVNPGTYILAGGGLSVTGTGALKGTGVTFYNTTKPGYAYKPVYTQDQANLMLSAPTSGPLAGMLFFQDRTIKSTALNVIGGGGGLEGALYFPTTKMSWSSQQSQAVRYTIIVADTFSIDINQVTVKSDYSSLVDGSPIRTSVLVE
jgi:Flp pilus assembly protein TadG